MFMDTWTISSPLPSALTIFPEVKIINRLGALLYYIPIQKETRICLEGICSVNETFGK
jgi:hypothetical protein